MKNKKRKGRRAQGQKEQTAKLDSASETTPQWDIICLCETYRKGEGLLEIRTGYWIYGIGKTEDNPDAKGLAFLIHSKFKDCITDSKTYSNRVNKMEIYKEKIQLH